MTEVLKHIPETTTFAANLVVFLAAIGAAVVGSMAMVKKVKDGWVDLAGAKQAPSQSSVVVGGLLQDAFGSAMMSEQVRDLVAAVTKNNGIADDIRDAICDNTRELIEMRHTMDRLMDRMDRR